MWTALEEETAALVARPFIQAEVDREPALNGKLRSLACAHLPEGAFELPSEDVEWPFVKRVELSAMATGLEMRVRPTPLAFIAVAAHTGGGRQRETQQDTGGESGSGLFGWFASLFFFFFFFTETGCRSVAQAGVQRCHLGSLRLLGGLR